jgi:4-amino-4-deoxy-L-arabinose transferase-like glycosyltransferase
MQDRNRNALLLIMIAASFLRLWNIWTAPSWDYDEGTILNISWNLLHGKFLLFNLIYPFIPHPPFFYIVTAGLTAVFGNDLTVLRVLAASCSIASVYSLFALGREMINVRFGLIASAVYAIYPNDIFFSRMGFANNLVALLSLVALLCIIKYRKEKKTQWLYYAASATGIAILTEYIAVALFLALALLVFSWDRKHLIVFSVISLAPMALFAAYMMSVMQGAFVTDFLHQFDRLRDYERSNIDASSNFAAFLLTTIFVLFIYRYKDFLKALYERFLWNLISLAHPGIGLRGSLKIASDTLFVSLL